MTNKLLFLGLLLTMVVACSSNVKTGGTVVFADGSVLDRGMVVLSNETSQYTGMIRPDGSFKLGGLKQGSGLPPGTYRGVVLDALGDDEFSLIANKFSSAELSGLVFEISKGDREPLQIVVEPPTAEELKRRNVKRSKLAAPL